TQDMKKPVRIKMTQTRFVGFKEALNRADGLNKWRRWVERPFNPVMGQSEGNAYHVPHFCRKCRSPEADMMHIVTHIPPRHIDSRPHRLPWLEDQPELPRNQLIIRDDDEADNL